MTYLDKALEIEKEKGSGMNIFQIMQNSCPSDYGFKSIECIKDGTAPVCIFCWNREMPSTETKVEVIPQSEVDAYNKGHADGVAQGLKDAWELARKIFTFNCNEMNNIFGFREKRYVFDELDVQEALAKLKAYEEAQNKIEIGDVVKYAGNKGLVLDSPCDKFVVLTDDGWIQEWYDCDVEKTGKHIDIQSILEQIGE